MGPQSEADAREYLANRVHKRRDGRLASSSRRKQTRQFQPTGGLGADVPSPASEDSVEDPSSAIAGNRREVSDSSLQVNWRNLLTPPASDAGASSDSGREDEKNDRKMFSSLEKPRTHYDVEVITKLVVYAGKFSTSSFDCPPTDDEVEVSDGSRLKETQCCLSFLV